MPAATAVTAAIVIGAVVYELGGRVLYELAVRRFTVLRALASLGKPRELQDRIKGTAVICGGRYVTPSSITLLGRLLG